MSKPISDAEEQRAALKKSVHDDLNRRFSHNQASLQIERMAGYGE